jgi:hypothetical protein
VAAAADDLLVWAPAPTPVGNVLPRHRVMTAYFNRGRSKLANGAEELRVVGGFNGWQHELFDFMLKPNPNAPEVCELQRGREWTWRSSHGRWKRPCLRTNSTCVPPQGFTWLHLAVPVPPMAYEMNFVFTDGKKYDNNGKKDYVLALADGCTPEEFQAFLAGEEARKRAAAEGQQRDDEEERRR